MRDASEREWRLADSYLPDSWTACQDTEEVWCVLDAIASGEDALDWLSEHRHWRSPAGRRQERDEIFESGHPLADGDR
jgi:hypothetical protein